MDPFSSSYRLLVGRAGKGEPVINAAVLTYAILFFLASVLNVLSPEWVSRNRLTSQASQIRPVYPNSSSLTGSNEKAVSRCVSRGLLLDMYDDPAVQRVRAEMDCGCDLPAVYEPHDAPTVCAIIQSFDREQNVEKIAGAPINNSAIQEIVICEDGSSDDSLEKWTEQLRDAKHFIVISNNLHEVRCYNRAMRLSDADYFILMQDDDRPMDITTDDDEANTATTNNWVTHALMLFDADPKLGILSGFIGQLWSEDVGFEFGEQTSDHGGLRGGKTYRIPFLSSRTLNPFMYCECAWAAPLFIRAEALHRVGGLDVGLFGAGEPGVWQDCVLSYAAWTAGWRVGVYDSRFHRGIGGHGSTSSTDKALLRGFIWQRAKDACDTRYDREYIHSHVLMLNNQTLVRRYDNLTY